MKNNFEFDKMVLAAALGMLCVILSNAVGGFIYRAERILLKPGYKIEVPENTAGDNVPKGLPEVLEMGKIMASAVADAGKNVFNKCAVCHTNDKDGANKVGPNLWGIVGAKVARHQEYKYSEAMSKRGQDGKIWGYEELYRYLYSPKALVPGNKMAFAGLKNDQDRANLIAYLRTLADAPVPLPSVEKQ